MSRPSSGTPAGRPLISVITPVLDRASLVGRAIESVLHQEHAATEHLVVDGGSTDGTLETLAGHAHLRVVSMPGSGIYEALNEGVARASGELIGFLNSDDEYPPRALEAVIGAFESHEAADQVGGLAEFRTPQGQGAPVARATMDLADLAFGAPVLNARFFRRCALAALGPFRDDLRYSGDRELLLRARLAGLGLEHLDDVVYRYHRHPGSLTLGQPSHRVRIGIIAEHLAMAGEYAALCATRRERSILRAWQSYERLRAALAGADAERAPTPPPGWPAHLPLAAMLKARTRYRRHRAWEPA